MTSRKHVISSGAKRNRETRSHQFRPVAQVGVLPRDSHPEPVEGPHFRSLDRDFFLRLNAAAHPRTESQSPRLPFAASPLRGSIPKPRLTAPSRRSPATPAEAEPHTPHKQHSQREA